MLGELMFCFRRRDPGAIGVAGGSAFLEEIVPNLRVEWVDEDTHKAASAAFLAADRI